MDIDRRELLQELGDRSDLAPCLSGDAMALVRDGRTARHIGPLFATTPTHALALVRDIVAIGATRCSDRCRRDQAQFLDGLTERRLDDRAAVSAHALGRATSKAPSCHLPSPAPNLDRNAMHHSEIKSEVRRLIADGTVLPAHPLALDADRKLDKLHQRALTRYYIDAGAGGLAVGVHTTQFAIRDVGLYRPVLELRRRPRRTGPSARWRWLPVWRARPSRRSRRRRPRAASAIMPACSALQR